MNPAYENPNAGGFSAPIAAPNSPHDHPYGIHDNVFMSRNTFLMNEHRHRINNTIVDDEDRPVLQRNVRLPAAPKKGHERSLNPKIQVQELRVAKRRRRAKRGIRRLQPTRCRRGDLFSSGPVETSRDSHSIGVDGWDDPTEPADILWEKDS